MQILILGTHRSGTSAITRLVNMMGAYFGGENASIGFNSDNPKGFWERKDVVACNDALLTEWQASWENVACVEDTVRMLPVELDQQIKSIVLELDAHRPWVVKDPRLCIALPKWKPFLEIPVCVMVYRDPLEVARSLHLRNGFSFHHGLAIWESYTVAALNAAQGMPKIFMNHADVLADPVAATKLLYEALVAHKVQGLRLPSEEEILAFIEPKLYRSKIDHLSFPELLNDQQMKLLPYAKGEKQSKAILLVSEGAKDAMAYYSKVNGDIVGLTNYKDHLFKQCEMLQDQIQKLESARTEGREALFKERDALLEHVSTISVSNMRLVDTNIFLETHLDRCLNLADSFSWRIGCTAVKLMNMLRLRFRHVDVLSDIKTEVKHFNSMDNTKPTR